ncbi:MAG: hypothetical protein HC822_07830 [Oscillochloris sp.]|nr:hypothetical protein [Oscillochloris sp.]
MIPSTSYGRNDARRLRARWERRLAEGNFSPVVTGVRRITQFGRPGAAPQAFPLVRAPRSDECAAAIIAALSADEHWALAMAERAVARGREVYAVTRHSGVASLLQRFEATVGDDILILTPAEG